MIGIAGAVGMNALLLAALLTMHGNGGIPAEDDPGFAAIVTADLDPPPPPEPDAVEEAKWRKASNPDGVPTFSLDGLICTVETYQDKVKVTFAKGASLEDPAGLFNASLGAGTRRAIDVLEGDDLDGDAFVALVREAVAANRG